MAFCQYPLFVYEVLLRDKAKNVISNLSSDVLSVGRIPYVDCYHVIEASSEQVIFSHDAHLVCILFWFEV